MINIAYILVSTDEDYYAENLLLSLYTLSQHNPDAYITLVTNKATLATFTGVREKIRDYISEYKIIEIPEKFTGISRSRYLKTRLRCFISGDYLFLDSDTIITGSLSQMTQTDGDILAVLEEHEPGLEYSQLKSYLKQTGCSNFKYRNYFNSGVLYVRDTPGAHKLYEDWHNFWLENIHNYGYFPDQPALARADFENEGVICEMSGIYNCQTDCMNSKLNSLTEDMLSLLAEAIVIHYFSKKKQGNVAPVKKEEFWLMVKQNGITSRVAMIADRLPAYYMKRWISRLLTQQKPAMQPMSRLGMMMAGKYPFMNNVASFILKLFNKNEES